MYKGGHPVAGRTANIIIVRGDNIVNKKLPQI